MIKDITLQSLPAKFQVLQVLNLDLNFFVTTVTTVTTVRTIETVTTVTTVTTVE